jgi:hypothetical protein
MLALLLNNLGTKNTPLQLLRFSVKSLLRFKSKASSLIATNLLAFIEDLCYSKPISKYRSIGQTGQLRLFVKVC